MQNRRQPNEAGINFIKEQIATVKKIMSMKDEDILKLIEAHSHITSMAEEKEEVVPLMPRLSDISLN